MIIFLEVLNYIVCAVVGWIGINTLRRRGWCSLLAVMTMSFLLSHMVGLYWAPDLLTHYRTPFEEGPYITMVALHIFCALVMGCGCFLQMRSGQGLGFVSHANIIERSGVIVFLGALLLLSLPVAVFMIAAFVLFGFGHLGRINRHWQALPPGRLIESLIGTPLFVVLVGGCVFLLAYDLFYLGTWEEVRTVVQSGGFLTMSEYHIYRKAGVDFIPSFLMSQIDTFKISILPFVAGILLLAFKHKPSWWRLVLFLVIGTWTGITLLGATLFAKSAFAIYSGKITLTLCVSKIDIGSGTNPHVTPVGSIIVTSIVLIACLIPMYYISAYSFEVSETLEQLVSRMFVVPIQSAYSWFYVFPSLKAFLGYSQSGIMSFLFGEHYEVAGYLPYEVAMLSTGKMFGLNANFIASAWARHGAWEAVLVPVVLVMGTLLVDRWLRSIPDLHVSWPVYAMVYVQFIMSVTAGFDALVISFGAWLLPVFCCVLLKLSRVYWV
jgi:hypothetical protein